MKHGRGDMQICRYPECINPSFWASEWLLVVNLEMDAGNDHDAWWKMVMMMMNDAGGAIAGLGNDDQI